MTHYWHIPDVLIGRYFEIREWRRRRHDILKRIVIAILTDPKL